MGNWGGGEDSGFLSDQNESCERFTESGKGVLIKLLILNINVENMYITECNDSPLMQFQFWKRD